MSARARLSNRRACESFALESNGLRYLATISRFPDGRLAEIFISNAEAGSHSDSAAKDFAVVASLALQHGVPGRDRHCCATAKARRVRRSVPRSTCWQRAMTNYQPSGPSPIAAASELPEAA
jgi:ribonucleoside-diphosphate reductase alpha chain